MSHPRAYQLLAVVVCAQLLLFCVPASADINWGNKVGTNVTYLNVTEGSPSGDPLPLFDDPAISGDGLVFSPTANFKAQSILGSPAIDITDGKLNTTIVTNALGGAIDDLSIHEAGDYTLTGSGAGSVSVGASVFLTVTELNDTIPVAIPLGPFSLLMSPSGGTFNLPGSAGTAVPWTGNLFVDINAQLALAGVELGLHATKVDYVMDNTLTALSSATAAGLITKKNGIIDLEVNHGPNIPEPSSLVLALLGAVGLAWQVRRRRAG